MKRIIAAISFILAVSLSAALLSSLPVSAETGDEVFTSEDEAALENAQDKLDEISAKKKELANALKAAKNEKNTAMQKKQLLEQEIEVLEDEISTLEDYIEGLTLYVAKLETRLGDKQTELDGVQSEYDEMYEKYVKRIRENYETDFGTVTYLEVVLTAKSFTEMLAKLDIIKSISDYETYLLESLKSDLQYINKAKEDIEETISEKNELIAEQNSMKAELEASISQKDAKVEEYDDAIADIEDDIDAYNAEQQWFAEQEAALEKEITALQDKKMKYGGGTLRWPLDSQWHTITSKFGWRTLNGVKEFHYAIDISATKGTPIYAAADGKIVYYSWTNTGGGNKCVIDHGSGLATHYNHMSKFVSTLSVGSTVKKGDLIGYVGSTGNSTGPHLDFKILVDGTAVNPLLYVTYDGSTPEKDINDLLD